MEDNRIIPFLTIAAGNLLAWIDGLSSTAIAGFLTVVGGAALWLVKEAGKWRVEHFKAMDEAKSKSISPLYENALIRIEELERLVRIQQEIIKALDDDPQEHGDKGPSGGALP